MVRHLHRDYHTAYCGIDASFVPMTYEPSDADCANCKKAYSKHLSDAAEREEAGRQAEVEFERHRQEVFARHAARLDAVKEEAKHLAEEQAKRDAEQLREWIEPRGRK